MRRSNADQWRSDVASYDMSRKMKQMGQILPEANAHLSASPAQNFSIRSHSASPPTRKTSEGWDPCVKKKFLSTESSVSSEGFAQQVVNNASCPLMEGDRNTKLTCSQTGETYTSHWEGNSTIVLRCMYTSQKNKKKKTWSDGAVKCCRERRRVALYRWSDVLGITDKLLGEVYLSVPEYQAFVTQAEEELEMELFIVSLEGITENAPPAQASSHGAAVGVSSGMSTIGAKRKLLKPFKPPARCSPPTVAPEDSEQIAAPTGRFGNADTAWRRNSSGRQPAAITNYTGFGHVDSLWEDEPMPNGPSWNTENAHHQSDEPCSAGLSVGNRARALLNNQWTSNAVLKLAPAAPARGDEALEQNVHSYDDSWKPHNREDKSFRERDADLDRRAEDSRNDSSRCGSFESVPPQPFDRGAFRGQQHSSHDETREDFGEIEDKYGSIRRDPVHAEPEHDMGDEDKADSRLAISDEHHVRSDDGISPDNYAQGRSTQDILSLFGCTSVERSSAALTTEGKIIFSGDHRAKSTPHDITATNGRQWAADSRKRQVETCFAPNNTDISCHGGEQARNVDSATGGQSDSGSMNGTWCCTVCGVSCESLSRSCPVCGVSKPMCNGEDGAGDSGGLSDTVASCNSKGSDQSETSVQKHDSGDKLVGRATYIEEECGRIRSSHGRRGEHRSIGHHTFSPKDDVHREKQHQESETISSCHSTQSSSPTCRALQGKRGSTPSVGNVLRSSSQRMRMDLGSSSSGSDDERDE